MSASFRLSTAAAFGLLTLVLAGCAEGPLWRLGALNPWIRKQWAQEEEKYGATLLTKINEIDSLSARAQYMDPAERNRWASTLSNLAGSDPHPYLRAKSVRALAHFPEPVADSALRAALKDRDPDVRIAACDAWAERGGPDAVAVLAETASAETNANVRLAAIRGLGGTGQAQPKQASQALAVALDDQDPAIQYRAVESLREISGRDYGNDLAAWREFARGGNPAPPEGPSIAERLRSLF